MWYLMTDLKNHTTKEFLTPTGVRAALRLGYILEPVR